MDALQAVRDELRRLADPADAEFLQRYFKTGPGEYGERDRFLGIRVPALRRLVRAHDALTLDDCAELLRSAFHEERLLALLLLVRRYERGDASVREAIYRTYLASTAHVDNWDLVDSSAAQIVGAHLEDRDRSPLLRLATSESIWERRIAIIATARFIKTDDFTWTLRIARMLLGDRHDLIHKAVGWMLREVGNRDRAVEQAFLREHGPRMPRTMLRYAIEKFPPDLRRELMTGTITPPNAR
ncbi:MAG TPA: DNA alkylation repair protein [Longimicrobiaceae bacterium]|nr:DNA alkylation repair protein [Longimicrobiaceae bacterium]